MIRNPKKRSPSSPSSKESYEEQRRVWYRKLKKEGFEDIEANDYDLRSPSYRFAHMDRRAKYTMEQAKIQWAAKQEYYYLANHFLNEHEFENNRERNIWEYHSNGVSIRDIVIVLNKLPGRKKVNRDTIWKIIRKLSKLMKEQYLKK
jgi:hypothetical protein